MDNDVVFLLDSGALRRVLRRVVHYKRMYCIKYLLQWFASVGELVDCV